MIKILQNWQDIQAAKQELERQNLPLHLDIHKNWDHLLLYEVIGKKDRQDTIVDLGCGECGWTIPCRAIARYRPFWHEHEHSLSAWLLDAALYRRQKCIAPGQHWE